MNPVIVAAMVKYRLNGKQIGALRALRKTLPRGSQVATATTGVVRFYAESSVAVVTLDALVKRGLARKICRRQNLPGTPWVWGITKLGIEASHGI